MSSERVVCASCGQPIKAKELGGIIQLDGKPVYVHDNFVCILQVLERKEEMKE